MPYEASVLQYGVVCSRGIVFGYDTNSKPCLGQPQ